MFKKRKASAYAEDLTNKVHAFMDECQKRTQFYYLIDKVKSDYSMIITEIIYEFPKEYKRILGVIDNSVDIYWKLTGDIRLDNDEYQYAATKLTHHFEFLLALLPDDVT